MPLPAHRLSLEQATQAILQGRLLIFPTETCYGIGCDAMNPEAVSLIFQAKRRAHALPLPVVAGSTQEALLLAAKVPPAARGLMERFWPGPLSLVLPARPDIPAGLTAGTGRIALRHSPHPAVQALCRATGRALVASSANISGNPAPSRAEDLDPELLSRVAGVFIDGPEPEGGAASTVIRIEEDKEPPGVIILRPGAVSAEALMLAGCTVVFDPLL